MIFIKISRGKRENNNNNTFEEKMTRKIPKIVHIILSYLYIYYVVVIKIVFDRSRVVVNVRFHKKKKMIRKPKVSGLFISVVLCSQFSLSKFFPAIIL